MSVNECAGNAYVTFAPEAFTFGFLTVLIRSWPEIVDRLDVRPVDFVDLQRAAEPTFLTDNVRRDRAVLVSIDHAERHLSIVVSRARHRGTARPSGRWSIPRVR